ncbi:uncharacterized protein [Epargyreus clarus]|uniref:uncharacterized protein n=1 Tax=Epargyreus clarus TaxID=520877 RepID=UPI003C2F7ACD
MSTTGNIKIHKKKKIVGELVADSLDNTAPVHKILEDLNHKNAQAYSLYRQTLKQRRTTKKHLQNFHFAVPGHTLNAVSDDWDGQLDTAFFEPFSHKSFPPKMINTLGNIGKSDPITDHLKLKHDWFRACKSMRQTAFLNNMTVKYEKLNDDVVRCPRHLVEMAAHMDSDPDPYFNSSYNWYYAGSGNLQLICINWVDYLLHSEFNCVYITEFNRVDNILSMENAAKFDCGDGVNILETICSSDNIVALRTRNRVFILKINITDDKFEFHMLKLIESEKPYTGISFDLCHKNILYVTTLDHNLTIVNLDRMMGKSVTLKANIRTLVDNWNTVISTERSFYTHIGRNSISLYDKRSNDAVYVWTDVRNVTDEMECNDISAAKQSEYAPLLYVTTDHHLFLMDLRFCERQKVSAVQRWTHGMHCVPTYITKCHFEIGKDLICLSSQWCEDMCVVPNFNQYRKEMVMCNLTMPYRPPSILKTLEEARNNKLCNNLYNPIDARLHTAISGCIILEQAEKYDVLLQNSLGDVSCHTIFPDHLETFMVDDSSQQLHDWCEQYELKKKDFEVSSVVNIAYIWKKLKKVPESYMTGDLKSTMRDKNRFNEKEIFDAFENEQLDSGLLEVWMKGSEDKTTEQSSIALNLHFSDSE